VQTIDVIKNNNSARVHGPLKLVGPCALHMLHNPLLRHWSYVFLCSIQTTVKWTETAVRKADV